ncbi:protein FAM114A2 [Anopheles bellator]|uniref:protein FAM114A2 n=1 Tax=Anopheles bellator TaxID=139047 RepID=UPI002647CC46|nr:protein FAM114A2 [Anopheles bellator]
MCDSDSEEFASADEDFEEIEPDELKAAVSETTASGELRSTKARTPKTSVTSDVDERKLDTKNDQHTSEKVVHSVHDEIPPEPLPSAVKIDVLFTPLEAEISHKDPPALPEPETVPEPTIEKSNEEQKASASSSAKEAPHYTTDSSVETATSKPRKLILKPARPQRLDEQTPEKEQPPSVPKVVEQPKPTEKPQATANDEGWDDFDDDWGDFSVDTGGSSAGGPKGKKEPKTEAKASFRDVDIDEVESKLQDFMIHRDDPPIASVLDRVATSSGGAAGGQTSDGQSWTGWKPSWGGAAVSFLSSASKSVASITTNITQVIESGIGVPNPEELARRQAETEAKLRADGYVPESEQETSGTTARKPSEDRFGFDQLVSGVTQISSKVITGGLDTLEGIGKKTMTILQENDPGLLNKRKLLGLQPTDGVVLSQVLREAKAKTEERERSLKQIQKHQYRKKLHFEALFDDYHGLVHLEALEMLSKQATLKLESLMEPLMGKALDELQETMGEVQELCELPEMDVETADADGTHTAAELEGKLRETIVDLDPSVKIDFGEIVKSWAEYTAWLEQGPEGASSCQDIFEKAMHALAQTTALCVLRMHKLAESLLISEHHSTATEADVLVQLTTVFCWHLSGVATRFGTELTRLNQEDSGSGDTDSTLVTNIFLEGSNSTSYIQNAFQLFIPILQLGAA